MLDVRGGVIYIGKAKNLKNRVPSYFRKSKTMDPKTRQLVSQIVEFETIVTKSEADALILESQLIKLFRPKYNIRLKDDKSLPIIKITKQDLFPRLLVVREKDDPDAEYLGPFPALSSSRGLKNMLYDLFPLRDCSQEIDNLNRQPKCIKMDIGKCLGPCVNKNIQADYGRQVEELKQLFSGKNDSLIVSLETRMAEYARLKKYERAAEVRDRIGKMKAATRRQLVFFPDGRNAHIWAVSENDDFFYALVQIVVDGKLLYQKGQYLDKNEGFACEDFLRESFFQRIEEFGTPQEVLVPEEFSGLLAEIKSYFDHEVKKAKIFCPMRGVKKELLGNAQLNAKLSVRRLKKSVTFKDSDQRLVALKRLQRDLKLEKLPLKIVGVDVSHLQGTNIVASAVYFKDGQPFKSLYRRFIIRSIDQSHDPAAINEVIRRRLLSIIRNGEEWPDLLLIDGGKPQLSFGYRAVQEIGMHHGHLDVVALAKKMEEIYMPDRGIPIRLGLDHPGLQILQQVRDEAHRFAVTFQRKRRKDTTLPKRSQKKFKA
ncbi:MAG: excinuclease ABC subunit C [Candidatus Marinamargulisbacteria bacterium]|jgi:excinuclease ABC subunit C